VLAQPAVRAAGAPSVLLLPDGRGLDDDYAALAARLAVDGGGPVLAMDLYGRTAGSGPRRPGFVSTEHSTALRWATVRLDLAAAVGRLRDMDPAPVVAVGCCLGGRVALLAATRQKLRLAGVAAFYPQTHGPARSDLPAPEEFVDRLTCPVLTVFGDADELIPAVDIAGWRAELAVAPVHGEVVVLRGAPHAFLDRRAGEFPAQAADGWARMLSFLGSSTRHVYRHQ
jgi:carboxymethylenebutenolidase